MPITFRDWKTQEVTKVEHEGLVVEIREQNLYHDSYFYATVFNPETGGFESFEYGATAYAGGGHAVVDAPPGLAEYYQDVRRENHERYERFVQAEMEAKERVTPSVGKVVKVVKGRKVPKGTEHTVFWYGENDYGTHRVGLESVITGERVFTAASNVEVVQGLVSA